MSPRLSKPGAKLGDDANFAGMAAKIRVNDGGALPRAIDREPTGAQQWESDAPGVRPMVLVDRFNYEFGALGKAYYTQGLSIIEARRRFRDETRQAPRISLGPTQGPQATPPTAETNYRQQVGELIKHVGAEKATQYVNQGLSLGEALEAELHAREAEKAQLSAAVAAKQATDQERARQDVLTAELQKQRTELEQLRGVANGETPKRKGFAGKLRFGGSFDVFGKHQQRGNK